MFYVLLTQNASYKPSVSGLLYPPPLGPPPPLLLFKGTVNKISSIFSFKIGNALISMVPLKAFCNQVRIIY